MGEPKPKMTVAEYLTLTDGSQEPEERLEWVNGEMYAMADGSPEHAAVAMNVGVALFTALRGKPCRPTTGDQRVAIDETGAYVYPDVTVVCGPFRRAADGISITNPSVVVEILSPTTAGYDRSAKARHYRHLPSLSDYLFIDPIGRTVEHFARQDGGWLLRDVDEDAVRLMDGTVDLAVADIFADLDHVIVEAPTS